MSWHPIDERDDGMDALLDRMARVIVKLEWVYDTWGGGTYAFARGAEAWAGMALNAKNILDTVVPSRLEEWE